jgi:SAM-dependent methyltransferase
MAESLPQLYTDLAPWYGLLTAPEDYVEEAAFYLGAFVEAAGTPPRTLLELGSGAGHLATHLKRQIALTLTDLSPQMLGLSRDLNPECEHIEGDMRTLRLGRVFDAVFVHDAVMYLTTEVDLRRGIETAFAHCRPGGVAIFAPDHLRETFAPGTEEGGHDGAGRALRYLAWSWDPDPADTTCVTDYAYLLREDGRPLRCVHDRHVEGLFGRDDWLRLLAEVGFAVTVRPLEHSEVAPGAVEIFVATRPATADDTPPSRAAAREMLRSGRRYR